MPINIKKNLLPVEMAGSEKCGSYLQLRCGKVVLKSMMTDGNNQKGRANLTLPFRNDSASLDPCLFNSGSFLQVSLQFQAPRIV